MLSFKELFSETTTLILEADHRRSMVKFGIPERVAELLHNFDNKFSIWFANEFKKIPEFVQASDADKERFVLLHRTHMQGIMDWVRSTANIPGVAPIRLRDYNWEDALRLATEWHNNLTANSLEGTETNTIIAKYPNGFYWVDLESSSCDEEKTLMGHCATSHKADTLYSLRKYDAGTNNKTAHVTIAVSPDENIYYQAKGVNNSKPKRQYYPYIADILFKKDIFKYTAEYNYANDFHLNDLREYMDENPEDFPNSEEYREKLGEGVTEEMFHQYAQSRSMGTITWSVIEDGGTIYLDSNFWHTWDLSPFVEDNWFDLFQIEIEKYDRAVYDIISHAVNKAFNLYISDMDLEYNKDTHELRIMGRVDIDSSNTFDLDEEGFTLFKKHIDSYLADFENHDEENITKTMNSYYHKICDEMGIMELPTDELRTFLETEKIPRLIYNDKKPGVRSSWTKPKNYPFMICGYMVPMDLSVWRNAGLSSYSHVNDLEFYVDNHAQEISVKKANILGYYSSLLNKRNAATLKTSDWLMLGPILVFFKAVQEKYTKNKKWNLGFINDGNHPLLFFYNMHSTVVSTDEETLEFETSLMKDDLEQLQKDIKNVSDHWDEIRDAWTKFSIEARDYISEDNLTDPEYKDIRSVDELYAPDYILKHEYHIKQDLTFELSFDWKVPTRLKDPTSKKMYIPIEKMFGPIPDNGYTEWIKERKRLICQLAHSTPEELKEYVPYEYLKNHYRKVKKIKRITEWRRIARNFLNWEEPVKEHINNFRDFFREHYIRIFS